MVAKSKHLSICNEAKSPADVDLPASLNNSSLQRKEEGAWYSFSSVDGIYANVGMSIEKFVTHLLEHGEMFGAVTCFEMSSGSFFSVRIRMRCLEYHRACKCKCTLTAFRYRRGGVWRVERRHDHSHDYVPKPSTRQSIILSKLRQEDGRLNYKAMGGHDCERTENMAIDDIREDQEGGRNEMSKLSPNRQCARAPNESTNCLRPIPDGNLLSSYSDEGGFERNNERTGNKSDVRENLIDPRPSPFRSPAEDRGTFSLPEGSMNNSELLGMENVTGGASHVPKVSTGEPTRGNNAILPSESNEEDLNESMHDSVKIAMECFVRSLEHGGRQEILPSLKHISESCGFSLRVRSSCYYSTSDSPFDKSLKILKKAIMECRAESCPFKCFVHGVCEGEHVQRGSGKSEERQETGQEGEVCSLQNPSVPTQATTRPRMIHYTLSFSALGHSCSPDTTIMERTVPPKVLSEAINMRVSYMRPLEIIRYLEDKYSILIDKNLFKRRLDYVMRTLHPAHADCSQLMANLSSMKEDEKNFFYVANVGSENKLHSVCFALPEWREDYKRYGVVPGISIDGKAIANRYDLPMFTVNGRTNYGKTCIFMVSFLASQTSQEIKWCLQMFKRCHGIPPKIITLDQDMAGINAAKEVFPTSFLILDEFHVNQNQKKNVSSFLTKKNRAHMCREMSNDLSSLRESQNEETFYRKRDQFEKKWFGQSADRPDIPRWYKGLYHDKPEIIVHCFNRMRCGLRFAFQGSGFTEAFNSFYKSFIIDRRVQLRNVPKELKRYTGERLRERERELQKTNKNLKVALQVTLLVERGIEADSFLQTFTEYAVRMFLNDVHPKIGKWSIVRHKIDSHTRRGDVSYGSGTFSSALQQAGSDIFSNRNGHGVTFFLKSLSAEENGSSSFTEVRVWMTARNGENCMSAACSCYFMRSAGIPCQHVTHVVARYTEYCSSNVSIYAAVGTDKPPRLHNLFHCYWKNNPTELVSVLALTRYSTVAPVISAAESSFCEVFQNHESPETDENRREFCEALYWCDVRALVDQMARFSYSRGAKYTGAFLHILRACKDQMSRNVLPGTAPTSQNPLFVPPSFGETRTAEHCTQSTAPRPLRQYTAGQSVQNPNIGRRGNRGSNQRARSSLEPTRGRRRATRVDKRRYMRQASPIVSPAEQRTLSENIQILPQRSSSQTAAMSSALKPPLSQIFDDDRVQEHHLHFPNQSQNRNELLSGHSNAVLNIQSSQNHTIQNTPTITQYLNTIEPFQSQTATFSSVHYSPPPIMQHNAPALKKSPHEQIPGLQILTSVPSMVL